MPAQLAPAVAMVTVTDAEWDLAESAVEVAVMVTELATPLAGVKVTELPELTFVDLLRVPAEDGLRERFTVLVKAPVPVTVGVQVAVCVSAMEVGLQVRETAVIVGGAVAAMEILAVPCFVESAIDVALTLSEPEAGTVAGDV
jgi:hypothetical protein